MHRRLLSHFLWLWLLLWPFANVLPVQGGDAKTPDAPLARPYPILFVTQLPVAADFTTIGSTFGNHHADVRSAGRGGDLWILYPDGTRKNLTQAAGYGSTAPDGFQDADAIAVRDPAVHWDGTKAIFSMVIGAPEERYQVETYYWQLYEITGLGKDETPVISKVANQPQGYNNISPIYGTDDRIIFTTDRPRSGEAHLYPQLDEYEEAPTNTGLWSLDPVSGNLRLLNHAPSGNFTPFIDSYGRVVFTQWDHLQRDQQADADAHAGTGLECDSGGGYGTFNYANESAAAAVLESRTEVYPEPRSCRSELLAGTNLVGHTINQFFPWTILEDGSEGEILNHLGRHELHGYIAAAISGDPIVEDYYGQTSRFNPNRILNMFQIDEDPLHPGTYYGVDAPEFSTHAAGQVISLTAPIGLDADHIAITYVTNRETSSYTEEGDSPDPNHSGLYREPLPLSDGTLVVVHTDETRADKLEGNPTNSRYAFRLKTLQKGVGDDWVAGATLTPGITKTIRYWDPDNEVTFNGNLWELNPVEVRPRTPPQRLTVPLDDKVLAMFTQAGVSPATLQAYLVENNLALAVTQNVTTRDDFDFQQPFNLQVAGGGVKTSGATGQLYEVSYLQFFQADQIRGWRGGGDEIRPGRRVLAQVMHDPLALQSNPALTNPNAPAGSVKVAADGSAAAFVPAQRALSWQLTDDEGVGVVRERYWVTFQPGEIRVCGSCHGLNDLDQAGNTVPTNSPQALLALLNEWKPDGNPDDDPTPTPSPSPSPSPEPLPSATPDEFLYMPSATK